jgi:ubiquinone/menaquinone biosynthesis C-methylase UbiE
MPIARPIDILGQLTALSDPTRCRILRLLERHELTVGELCLALQLPQSTVSRHLKVLGDESWVDARGEGTSRFYKSSISDLDSGARDLWMIVRAELGSTLGLQADNRRAESVVAKRRAKVRLFFDKAADLWDEMRAQLVGGRTDLLALLDLLDPDWVVGDLGCGTGHIAEALSPAVARVIAVDESGPMLAAARARLENSPNVELREGHIESLPLDDATLDVAILFLVAHFISDPARAMEEVRRVLKPGGRLLIVDLTSHDRAEYVVQLGHIWQGFDAAQVAEWLTSAGFTACRYRLLDNDGNGRTPGLFVASARRAMSPRASAANEGSVV